MAKLKKTSNIPKMNDEELAKFWENNEPEDFGGLGAVETPKGLKSEDVDKPHPVALSLILMKV